MSKSEPPKRVVCHHHDLIEELASRVGDFIEYWGFKKIHGRIWTHLMMSQSPLTSSDLIHRLKVSKGLVSVSLKDLLYYQVILENPKIQGAPQTYSVNPQIIRVICNVLRGREKKLINEVHGAFNLIKSIPESELKSCGVDTRRMQDLEELICGANLMIDGILALSEEQVNSWRNLAKTLFS